MPYSCSATGATILLPRTVSGTFHYFDELRLPPSFLITTTSTSPLAIHYVCEVELLSSTNITISGPSADLHAMAFVCRHLERELWAAALC